jgi:hypothetical protein
VSEAVRPLRIVLVAVAVALVVGGSRVTAQKSALVGHWRTREIVVDGDAGEWEGLRAALTDEKVSVGVVNDGEMLYFCLTASDLQTRGQILREGLIVWFDPTVGTKHTFGIKFPVGLQEVTEGRSGTRPPRGTAKKTSEPIEVLNRLEVLGPGKDDRRSLVLDQVPGVHAIVGQPEGSLVYELSIPLVRTSAHPYAIGSKPGSMIGLGLATPEPEKGIIPADGPARSGPGERGGMGGAGGMGGMRSGMGTSHAGTGRGESTPLKPMKTWLRVQLASSASDSHGERFP